MSVVKSFVVSVPVLTGEAPVYAIIYPLYLNYF